MQTFEITAPDGATYEITAPDGATHEHVMAKVRSLTSSETPVTSATNASPTNEVPKQSYLAGLANSAANSATWGFADELTGVVQAALPFPFGTGGSKWDEGEPQTFAEDYATARDSARGNQEQFSEDHPISDLAASVVPALLQGPGIIKAGAKVAETVAPKVAPGLLGKIAASPGARYAAGMAGGTASGAVAGYGYGEDLGDAAQGGAVGMMASALFPPAAKLGGYLGNKVTEGAGAAVDLMKSPEKRFARKVAQEAGRDSLSPEMVGQRMAELGPEAMPVDVSPNLLTMGEAYAQSPGPARAAATKALEERAKGAQKRIVDDLFESTGVDDVDIDSAIQNLHATMREVGKGYNSVLDDATIELTPVLERLMEGPELKKAVAHAYRMVGNDIAIGEADTYVQKFFKLNDNGEGMFAPMTGKSGEMSERPTLRVWNYIKQGLDAVIHENSAELTGKLTPLGRQAQKMKTILLKHLDEAGSSGKAYKQVRNAYADELAAEDAMLNGRRFMSNDAETTARKMSEMSDAEQQFYKVGAARALYDKVRSRREQFKQWEANPTERDKIIAVMGKEQGERFIKRLETESTFNATKNAVLGGSPTARRMEAMAEASQDPAGIISNATSPQNWILGMLQRDAKKIPEGMLQVGADVLYSPQSTQQIRGLLSQPLVPRGLLSVSPEVFYGGLLGGSAQLSAQSVR